MQLWASGTTLKDCSSLFVLYMQIEKKEFSAFCIMVFSFLLTFQPHRVDSASISSLKMWPFQFPQRASQSSQLPSVGEHSVPGSLMDPTHPKKQAAHRIDLCVLHSDLQLWSCFYHIVFINKNSMWGLGK